MTTRDDSKQSEKTGRTAAMTAGRHQDTTRRRQRVLTAIEQARTSGTDTSVSSIARSAGVDRTFLYRHRDLLTQLHSSTTEPTATGRVTVSRSSLQADLLAAQERASRIHSRTQQLERRLSEVLGEKAWKESGLGSPPDIDALQQQITSLEQQVIDLRLQLEERDQDLTAARAANRELMTQINGPHHR
jgi:chromosome segregation ATPase